MKIIFLNNKKKVHILLCYMQLKQIWEKIWNIYPHRQEKQEKKIIFCVTSTQEDSTAPKATRPWYVSILLSRHFT